MKEDGAIDLTNLSKVEEAVANDGQQAKVSFPSLTVMWHPKDEAAPVRVNYDTDEFPSLDLVLCVLTAAVEQVKAVMAVNRSIAVSNHLRQQAVEAARDQQIARSVNGKVRRTH